MSRIHSANGVPGDRVAADALVRRPKKKTTRRTTKRTKTNRGKTTRKAKGKRTKEKAIQYEYRPTLWPSIALTDREIYRARNRA